MSLVDSETGEKVEPWPDWWLSDAPLTKDEAEKITAQITGYVGMTWRLIAIAHDRQAHKALGFATFADYLRDRFDVSKSQGYRLIQHARVMELLGEAAGLVSPAGDSGQPLPDLPERATRDIDPEIVAADIAARVTETSTTQERVTVIETAVAEHHETDAERLDRQEDECIAAIAADPEADNPTIADRVGCSVAVAQRARRTIEQTDAAPPAATEPAPDGADEGTGASTDDAPAPDPDQAGGDPPAPLAGPDDGEGSDASPPASDLATLYPDETFRINANKAIVKVYEALSVLDAERLAQVTPTEDRGDITHLAEVMRKKADQLDAAFAAPTLRSVQ